MSFAKEKRQAQLQLAAMLGHIAGADDCNTYKIASGVAELARIAGSLHKRYENACSYQWANEPAYEKRTANLEAKAAKVAKGLGIELELQTDPRGWPLICKVMDFSIRLGG